MQRLKDYKLEFVFNDNSGVHAEIKILKQLCDENTENPDSTTYKIGTSLKTCLHCEGIYEMVERHFPKIKVIKRQSHNNYYEFTTQKIVPLIVKDLKLESLFLEELQILRIKL